MTPQQRTAHRRRARIGREAIDRAVWQCDVEDWLHASLLAAGCGESLPVMRWRPATLQALHEAAERDYGFAAPPTRRELVESVRAMGMPDEAAGWDWTQLQRWACTKVVADWLLAIGPMDREAQLRWFGRVLDGPLTGELAWAAGAAHLGYDPAPPLPTGWANDD